MVQKTTVVRHKPNGQRKKKHTGLIVVVILAILAIATAGVLLFMNRDKIFQDNTPKEDTSSKEEPKSEKEEDSSEVETEEQKTDAREEEKASVSPYEGEDPNTLGTITGVINFAGISEGNFIITATLDQELGDSGNCNFVVTRGSAEVIVSSVPTSAGPTTSFCTYSVPATSISAGHYNINIEVTGSGKKGVITGEADL